MKFVYQPEGAEPRKWDYAPEKLMSPEAEAIERVTKLTYGEWSASVGRGSMTALHALLWVMLKREDPTLTYAAVEFSLSDVTFELTDEESADALATLEARLANGEDLLAEELAVMESLRADLAPRAEPAAPEVEGEGGEDGPKSHLRVS